eukprot:16432931-Heterocapsa_arctica.AAC.1
MILYGMHAPRRTHYESGRPGQCTEAAIQQALSVASGSHARVAARQRLALGAGPATDGAAEGNLP